jgi:hypothetical protein
VRCEHPMMAKYTVEYMPTILIFDRHVNANSHSHCVVYGADRPPFTVSLIPQTVLIKIS